MFLYGGSINEIQGYIYETNTLKEIIGASSIIEYIVKQLPGEILNVFCKPEDFEVILSSAGKIKILFRKEDCIKKFASVMPMKVQRIAPGISFSQSIVNFDENNEKEAIKKLQLQLQMQKNRTINRDIDTFALATIARRTGNPAVSQGHDDFLDIKSAAKQNFLKENKDAIKEKLYSESGIEFPKEFSELSNKNSFMAIIHIDINNLGSWIENLKKPENIKHLDFYKKVSEEIEKITINTFRDTLKSLFVNEVNPRIRPIVLGGDDLTFVCHPKYALKFVNEYLQKFEEETKEKFESDEFGKNSGLKASTGIAYTKEKFPFHYGISLSDTLCTQAKKESKRYRKMPSTVLFHKFESSYFDDYDELVSKMLKAPDMNFDFGPYGVSDDILPSLDKLNECAKILNTAESPKSRLRSWIGVCFKDSQKQETEAEKISNAANKNFAKFVESFNNKLKALNNKLSLEKPWLEIKDDDFTSLNKSPIHDIINIAGLQYD